MNGSSTRARLLARTHAVIHPEPGRQATSTLEGGSEVNSRAHFWICTQHYKLAQLNLSLTLSHATSMSAKQATLLFGHGAGFCKQIWDPVIRRMQQSPLLQAVNTDVVNFDLRYHGTQRDESVAPKVVMLDPKTPRVSHPGDRALHTTAEDVQQQVDRIRAHEQRDGAPRSPIIGVGHSMAACGMWTTEMKNPGTFDGLILFEPIYGFHRPENKKLADFFVSVTLQRESRWCVMAFSASLALTISRVHHVSSSHEPTSLSFSVNRPTREEAIAHFRGLKNFASWNSEALDGFLDGAIVDHEDGGVALACNPLIEASFYSGETMWLSEAELARPRCAVSFQRGERSALFNSSIFAGFAEQFPHIYKLDDALPGRSHLMVMEDPDTVSARVLRELQQFAPFANLTTSSLSEPVKQQQHEVQPKVELYA